MSALKIQNLSLKFKNHTVLEEVSLDIKQGEYLGLIGPNGAGKSSLIKCILGLVKPTSGKIEIASNIKFAYVPQYFLANVEFSFSVYEVLKMGSDHLSFFSGSKERLKAIENLCKVGLDESFLGKNFLDLSGGQKQRVVIARALMSDPNFLIFDEAFSNLDMNSKINIYQLLAKINTHHQITILFVSHEIDKVIEKCQRILCLNKHLHEGCHPIDFMSGKISPDKDANLQYIHHHHNHSTC